MSALSYTLRRQIFWELEVRLEDHSPGVSIFAHPVQKPPWGPFKGPKIAAGYLLKDSVKIWGVQGRRGVGGRKPPPPEDQNTHASSLKTRVGEYGQAPARPHMH
jgi:hypothetical protein